MANSDLSLYLISQNVNNDWDTYDSAVVAARDEDDAKHINPDGYMEEGWWKNDDQPYEFTSWSKPRAFLGWCHPEDVKVEYIGKASPDIARGVVCSSFNAG
jgi:hypothetical protein